MDKNEEERAKRESLKRYMPIVVIVVAFGAFVLIRLAGYPNDKALIGGAIMLVLGNFIWKLPEWLGVRGTAAVMGAWPCRFENSKAWLAVRHGACRLRY